MKNASPMLVLLSLLLGSPARASESTGPEGFTDTVCRFYYPSSAATRTQPHIGQRFIGQIFNLPPHGWVVQTAAEVEEPAFTFRKLLDGNLDKMIGTINGTVGQKMMTYKMDREKIELDANYVKDGLGVIGHTQEVLFGEPEHCLTLFWKITHPNRANPNFIKYKPTKIAKRAVSQVLVMLMDMDLAPFQTPDGFQRLHSFSYEFPVADQIWGLENTRPDSFANH